MSSSTPKQAGNFRFSLGYLIVFTAIVATWTSAIISGQKQPALQSQRNSLAGIATFGDSTKVVVKPLPKLSEDFQPFDVYIPDGKPRELRFFCGGVSEAGLPSEFESVSLSNGQHKIIFREQDNLNEGYRFQLYVDGLLALDKSMGKEWMPLGWSKTHRFSKKFFSEWRQRDCNFLDAKLYVDKGNDYIGPIERWKTSLGYQLWIDEVGRTPPSISEFLDVQTRRRTIGLCNGLRLEMGKSRYLTFQSPRHRTAFALRPKFKIGDEDVVFSKHGGGPEGWTLSGSADQIEDLDWKDDSASPSRSAFLHATPAVAGKPSPVMELQWTTDRPLDVGLRLPAVPGNASITKWRLRYRQKERHYLSDIEIDERRGPAKPYFFQGLPFQLGVELIAYAWAIHKGRIASFNEITIPGQGAVDELVIEYDVTDPSWVWLRFKGLGQNAADPFWLWLRFKMGTQWFP